MDLYCPRCGEPWDLDTLHEETAARIQNVRVALPYETAFAEVRRDFQQRGCAALGEPRCLDRDGTATVAAAVYELLGDDLDGAAAMLDDAHRLGML